MDRNRIFIKASEVIANNLQDKYPGLLPYTVREVIKDYFKRSFDYMLETCRTVFVDSKYKLNFYIGIKPGYNHVPKEKRGIRAVSYNDLGTELEITPGGKIFYLEYYNVIFDKKYKKQLQEKVDDPEFIQKVL